MTMVVDAGVADAGRYDRVARALHWAMALLIIVNLIIGMCHDALEKALGTKLIPLHKSIGLTVFALVLVRILWRLTNRPPALPADTPSHVRRLAAAAHLLLYVLMVVMPLTGWIWSSSSKYPLGWFGLFTVKKFAVSATDTIVKLSAAGHHLFGAAMAALVVAHVLAALRHHFILRDAVLDRMSG